MGRSPRDSQQKETSLPPDRLCVRERRSVCWKTNQVCFGKPWAALSRDPSWGLNLSGGWNSPGGRQVMSRSPHWRPGRPSSDSWEWKISGTSGAHARSARPHHCALWIASRFPSHLHWESLVARFVWRNDSDCPAVHSTVHLMEKMWRESPQKGRLWLSVCKPFPGYFVCSLPQNRPHFVKVTLVGF